jgi:hypothetical protein
MKNGGRRGDSLSSLLQNFPIRAPKAGPYSGIKGEMSRTLLDEAEIVDAGVV